MEQLLMSTELQTALANILLTVFTAVLAAVGRAVIGWIKTNTSAQQFGLLQAIASDAVSAAEQGAIAGFVSDRKATAIAIVNVALRNAGITGLTAEQIDAAIEAAVKDVLNPNASYGDAAPVEEIVE